MNMEKDILDKLKKPSFSTPEGYFDKLKAHLEEIPGKEVEVSTWQKSRPYLVMAACFLLSLIVGTGILKMTTGQSVSDADQFYYDLGYADLIPVTYADPSLYEDGGAAELSSEEIEDYLIATGVSVNRLAYSETLNGK
jgi:hypothetical protein